MTVTVPATEVTSIITVAFDKVIIADNRQQRIYETLERAQMDYGLKHKIWKVINEGSEDMLAALSDIEMSDSVRACIFEVV